MKWALVIAGISDLGRPAEKLSATQNAALTATGLIWTRWCLIIKPKNYLYVPPSILVIYRRTGGELRECRRFSLSRTTRSLSPADMCMLPLYRLAAVNFFLGIVGVVQCTRIFMWHQSQKNKTLPEKVEEVKEEVKEAVKA